MNNNLLICLGFKLLTFAFLLILNFVSYGQEISKSSIQNYLGQTPPGMTAQLFAPGIISSELCEHSSPAFSPDGKIVVWTIMDSQYHGYLLEMRYEDGKWSAPAKPSFAAEKADDYYATFSADGKKLYFSSRRPVPKNYPETKDIRIWEVNRTSEGWGTPIPLDTTVSLGYEYAHSVAKNGTIYFSFRTENSKMLDIAYARKKGKHYQKPDLLGFGISSEHYEDGPFIASDESYLIFESNRPGGIGESVDLYISFRKKDGTWAAPKNMGEKINTEFGERFARLSPDGKYLFFGSTRSGILDIYWIDAKIIDELRENR